MQSLLDQEIYVWARLVKKNIHVDQPFSFKISFYLSYISQNWFDYWQDSVFSSDVSCHNCLIQTSRSQWNPNNHSRYKDFKTCFYVMTGDANGSDIMLEAILEAEVAQNAKQFFAQPQNQIPSEWKVLRYFSFSSPCTHPYLSWKWTVKF